MTAQRTMFPTLADIPRSQWPTGLRIVPGDPARGEEDVVTCRCSRTVPAREMVDLRELDPSTYPDLGITSPVLCQGCFHHTEALGHITHEAIATALGMHPNVIASLRSGSREALSRGWHQVTPRNRHLAP